MDVSEFNRKRLDMILEMFDKTSGGSIEKTVLFNVEDGHRLPPDYDKALAHLVGEGCLDEGKYGYTITYKGRAILNEGGFVGKYRREVRARRLERIGILVGIITGVAGLVLSIVALLN